jgi:hypothetical protein
VDVRDPEPNEVTASQLAVDCGVEHREVTDAAVVLEPRPNGPDMPLV